MKTIENNNSQDAVIHLKDGKRKHGLLMNELSETGSFMFIPYNSNPYFSENGISAHAEIIPGILIEAIETDLK
ncbi:MAG: hypothetical protein K0S44_1136 [Bacteroidetes bacterium]|jgi:hypothetical protein|nr:hypothetical protein [Bacteroidota bacterium]